LSTPNPAYFTELAAMVNLAASYGLVVFLGPYDILDLGDNPGQMMVTLQNNGTTKCFNYGAFLGNWGKNLPNLVWLNGNDFQSWNTSATDNDLVFQVMNGIKSADPNHLQTIELNYIFSYSNLNTANLSTVLGIDHAYTYGGTYDEVLQGYNSSPTLPVFLGEGYYEGGNATKALPAPATPYNVRKEEYWSITSGATGFLMGHNDDVIFAADWQTVLNAPGQFQIAYIKHFFSAYPWWTLVPDQEHQVVSAGYGSYAASDLTAPATNNYVSTLSDPAGSLAIVYSPGMSSGATTLTVNLGLFNNLVTARWFDPSNGTYSAIAGSPFINSGSHNFIEPLTNSEGTYDQVLVLQSVSVPGVAFNPSSVNFPSTLTGNTAQRAITLTNTGTAALLITSITASTTGGGPTFAQSNGCPASLAANAFCTITATFTPAAAQFYPGLITVVDNAGGSGTVALSGTGLTP
jgi:hypothetical protein